MDNYAVSELIDLFQDASSIIFTGLMENVSTIVKKTQELSECFKEEKQTSIDAHIEIPEWIKDQELLNSTDRNSLAYAEEQFRSLTIRKAIADRLKENHIHVIAPN